MEHTAYLVNPNKCLGSRAILPPLKIALISPKGPLYRHRTGIFRKDLRAGPLTLTTLASLIPDDIAAEVSLYDEGIEDLPENLDASLIGMTVITGTAPRSYELAEKYRSEGITVVLGGPHVTLVPEESAKYADSIVTGFAEETWPALLQDFVVGELKPRYDMDKNFSFQSMPSIPFAKRELLKKKGYKTTHTFEATRGCIHRCNFCVVPHAWGTRPFQKPISHIIDDIKQVGSKRILFYDLNLLADFKYAKELFTALIPLKLKWFGLSTTLIGKSPELMELCAKSGCCGLLIGFESVSKTGLKDHNKSFNSPDTYGQLIADLHRLRISIMGTFVFGNDSDTKDSFSEVKEFVLTHKVDLPRFSVMTPFPGTELFSSLNAENRILTRDWSLYDGQHVVFEPRTMSAKELLAGHEKLWRDVYSYSAIWKRIGRHSDPLAIVIAANLGYRFYAANLERFYTCRGGML
jgi:radical SAM superfamily enzyme YgiQ (UPF0313 family)